MSEKMLTRGDELRQAQQPSRAIIVGRTIAPASAGVPHNAVGGCIMVCPSPRVYQTAFDLLSPEVR